MELTIIEQKFLEVKYINGRLKIDYEEKGLDNLMELFTKEDNFICRIF